MEHIPVERLAKVGASVEPTPQKTRQVRRVVHRETHAVFEAGQQNLVAESGETLAAIEAEVGGSDGAAGDAADQSDVVEQIAVARLDAAERVEHAVGERRGPQASA